MDGKFEETWNDAGKDTHEDIVHESSIIPQREEACFAFRGPFSLGNAEI